MISITLKAKGAEELKRICNEAADRILVRTKRVLEDFAAPLVTRKAREQLTSKAKNSTGLLAGSLYNTTAKKRGMTTYIKLGWGYPYGSVLEFGPTKTTWEIRAKHAKALRIPLGFSQETGEVNIIYRKVVVHRWHSSMLREHYGPAIDAAWPAIETKLAEAMELD